MARIENYIMTFIQRHPKYKTEDIGTIREKLNEEFNLQLEDDDVEAALLNIRYNGEYGDGVKEIPDNFEWE